MSNGHSQKDQKMVFKTDYRLMQVKSIAECSEGREHFAILSTFIKLPVVIKIFALSIFEWPFYTGFTVSQLSIRTLASTFLLVLLLKVNKICLFTIPNHSSQNQYTYAKFEGNSS